MKPSERIDKIVKKLRKSKDIYIDDTELQIAAIIQFLDEEAAKPKEYIPPPRFCK